jgi:hypothetical protein
MYFSSASRPASSCPSARVAAWRDIIDERSTGQAPPSRFVASDDRITPLYGGPDDELH